MGDADNGAPLTTMTPLTKPADTSLPWSLGSGYPIYIIDYNSIRFGHLMTWRAAAGEIHDARLVRPGLASPTIFPVDNVWLSHVRTHHAADTINHWNSSAGTA